MTLADIAMMERLNALIDPEDPLFSTHYDWLTTGGQGERTGLLSKFPLLDSLRVRVSNVPEIKRYLDQRPECKVAGF